MIRLSRLGIAAVLLVTLFVTACTRSPEERRKRFIQNGLAQMEKKDYARAILEFTNASQAVPTHPEAYYRLGMAHLESGDVRRGVAFLRKAIAVDPNYGEAKLKLSELMILSDDPGLVQDAQDQLKQLLSASPNNAEAITALAVTEWKLSDPKEAEKHLMEALDKMPSFLSAAVSLAKVRLQQKDFAGAEKILKSVAEQTPPSAPAFVALGEFYVVAGRLEDAAKQYRRALEIESANTMALTDLAALEIRLGHTQEADEVYKRIAALPDPKARPIHALFLLQTGKLDQAIQEFKTLVSKYPDDRDLRNGLIGAYMIGNRAADAEKLLDTALKANPRDVAALVQRASLRVSRHQLGAAETDLQLALRQAQDSPQVHFGLAQLSAARGDAQGVRAQLNDALRAEPTFAAARIQLARLETNTNGAKTALDLLNQAPEAQKNSPEFAAERNWAFWVLGQRADFEKSLQAALAQAKLPELMLQDALLKYNLKQYEQARASARAVLVANPSDVRALQMLFLAFDAEKKTSDGLAALKQFAAQNPASAAVQQYVGSVLLDKGRSDEARDALVRAKTADPAAPGPFLALAQMDAKAGQLDRSKSTLQDLLAVDSRNATAHLWLGNIALMKNDFRTAEDEFRKTIAVETNNVSALNNLAYILSQKANKADEALAYAQKARELAPKSGAIANTLGMVYYQKGLYKLAIPFLKDATQLDKNAGNTFDLGLAYFKNGDVSLGRQTLSAALKMDSGLPQAQQARELLASSAQ